MADYFKKEAPAISNIIMKDQNVSRAMGRREKWKEKRV